MGLNAMVRTTDRPMCAQYAETDGRDTCPRPVHVRRHDFNPTPSTPHARARVRATQAFRAVVAGDDWGTETPFDVTPAAPTLEHVCPVHGVVHSEY